MNQVSSGLRRDVRRWPFLILAYGSIALAGVGVVLPGLPTTPFVLVAAWSASRGSDRLHAWLYEHRHFGPPLKDWAEQRAVSPRAKVTAVALLALSWTMLTWTRDSAILALVTAVFFALVAIFLVTRPNPRRKARALESQDDRCAGG